MVVRKRTTQPKPRKRVPVKKKYGSLKDHLSAKKDEISQVLKSNIGRTPTYNDQIHPQLAFKFSLLGCSNQQLADALDISLGRLGVWLAEHKNFHSAVFDGRKEADANVAKALYHRALGRHWEEKTYERKIIGKKEDGEKITDLVITKVVTRYTPPDVPAIKFWLWNRTKTLSKDQQWNDKQSIDLESSDGSMSPVASGPVIILPQKDMIA